MDDEVPYVYQLWNVASMKVTVAICTWNRADLLDQTLAEMRKLRIPVGVDW